jgi:hypothetical protein
VIADFIYIYLVHILLYNCLLYLYISSLYIFLNYNIFQNYKIVSSEIKTMLHGVRQKCCKFLGKYDDKKYKKYSCPLTTCIPDTTTSLKIFKLSRTTYFAIESRISMRGSIKLNLIHFDEITISH